MPQLTNITVEPASALPENADVILWVDPGTQKRYVRWVAGDETDALPPKVVYHAPGWVWMLYQQGRTSLCQQLGKN
jgi:hypothetical protein